MDELAESIKMIHMTGMKYRLEFDMVTGVQTLTLADGKKSKFLAGKLLPWTKGWR